MITLSSNIQACLASLNTQNFLMVRAMTPPSTIVLNTTSHYSAITLSDSSMYQSDQLLIGADNPQQSTSVDREQYTVTIADPTFSFGPTVETGIVGKILESRAGFINTTGATLSGILPGAPFTSLADTILLYRGRIDSAAYSIDTGDIGSVSLIIKGASPMMNLDRKREFYLNRDAIRKIHPSDSCCDQIFEGSSGLILKWGKV